jgi:enoyl-CoA hydratase/carnithine racemase
MIEVFHGIFRRMDALGVVSVASLQGAALGGGCEAGHLLRPGGGQ